MIGVDAGLIGHRLQCVLGGARSRSPGGPPPAEASTSTNRSPLHLPTPRKHVRPLVAHRPLNHQHPVVPDANWPAETDVYLLFAEDCGGPEEFVREPASIVLLGSGLMGLAGCARLRLRKPL